MRRLFPVDPIISRGVSFAGVCLALMSVGLIPDDAISLPAALAWAGSLFCMCLGYELAVERE